MRLIRVRFCDDSGSGSAEDSSLQSDPFDLAWQDDKKFAAAAAALQASLSSLGDNARALHDLQSPSLDAAPAQSHQAFERPSAEPTNRPRSYIEPPDFVYAPQARELRPDPRDDPCDLFEIAPQGIPFSSTTIPAPPAATIRQRLLRRVRSALKISSMRRRNF